VPIGRKGVDALKVWLKERAGMVKSDVDALFVGQSGRPLSARAVQLRVGAWGRRQALNVHVHPAYVPPLRLPHICSSPAAICAACRNCSATPILGPTQIYYSTWISNILATVYDNAHREPGAARSLSD